MENIVLFHFYYESNNNYYVEVITNNPTTRKKYKYKGQKIEEKLHDFQKFISKEEEEKCFNELRPWKEIVNLSKNDRVIIAFNIEQNLIQGWCNIQYTKDDTNDKCLLYIQYIVTRNYPEIKGVGTYIMNFIKDNLMNEIKFEEWDPYKEVFSIKQENVFCMFLISKKSSNDFYKKLNFLEEVKVKQQQNGSIALHDTKKHGVNYDESLFYYINPKYLNTPGAREIKAKLIKYYNYNTGLYDYDSDDSFTGGFKMKNEKYKDFCSEKKNKPDFINLENDSSPNTYGSPRS